MAAAWLSGTRPPCLLWIVVEGLDDRLCGALCVSQPQSVGPALPSVWVRIGLELIESLLHGGQ